MRSTSIAFLLLILGACRTTAVEQTLQESDTAVAATDIETVPGENYLAQLVTLIQSAQHSITILHFNFFTENGETRKLAQLIRSVKEQRPGLSVDIILEGEKGADKPNGAAKRNRKTKDFFAGSGVNVHFISGLRKDGVPPGVTHAKAVIVDNIVLTGSTNLTNTSLTKNNEFNLLLKNAEAAAFLRNFVKDLQQNSTALLPRTLPLNKYQLFTDNTFHAEAIRVIQQAAKGESLYLSTYFFRTGGADDQDAEEIQQALLQAQDKGVNIKIYLERSNNPDVNDDVTKANINVAKILMNAGMDVYFDPLEKISHSKMIIVDGKKKILLQGSTNLYRGDLNENHQVNIRIDDAATVSKALSWLMAKIAYDSTSFRTLTTGLELPKMYRLWFGYGQNRSDLTTLIDGVNQRLVPATTQYAKGRGLAAYLPALVGHDDPHASIPDEVAIISYQTADMYDAARMTPPYGPLYGPLHFSAGLFAKETSDGFKSGSAVTKPFAPEGFTLSPGLSGYHIWYKAIDWQDGPVNLYFLKGDRSNFAAQVRTFLEDLKDQAAEQKINGALVAVDSSHELLAVWIHGNTKIQGAAGLEIVKTILYTSQADGAVQFGLDSGANVKFETKLLEGKFLMEPILK